MGLLWDGRSQRAEVASPDEIGTSPGAPGSPQATRSRERREPRLYDDLAYLWPVMSPPEHYATEAETIRTILHERTAFPAAPSLAGRPEILELGAGGGHLLSHLEGAFDAVAVDLSDAMLAHCRRLNPGADTVVGDMRSVRLGRRFDAVLIHDAIDYMTSAADLSAALQTAAAHLDPGGVLLAAPTYVRETLGDREIEHDTHRDGALEVTYISYVHDPDPTDDTFELILVFFVRTGGQVHIEEDRHTCGLFGTDQWLRLLDHSGFDAHVHPEDQACGWTLFVAVRR